MSAPRLEERLRIEPDGTVVAMSGKVEYGQGLRATFASLVAEELRLPRERVRVVLGDTALVPWDMGTFGSLSVRSDGVLLRRAAAFARGLLAGRAAHRFDVPPDHFQIDDGVVRAPDGRSASYAELVAGEPLTGDIPDDVPLTPRERWRVMGKPAGRVEARAIVTGAARYVGDLRLPGMLHARVLHPPSLGARLVALDDAAARARPGVVAVVREGDFVGLVAERAEQAREAVKELEPEWAAAPPGDGPARLLILRDGDVDEALAAGLALDAEYVLPHVANAPIGTSVALADVREGTAVIHAATQRPFGVREEVASLLGLPTGKVRVIAELAAGTYGRNNASDAPLEAARLSRAVGRPVRVEWSRAAELRAAPSRPAHHAHIRAALGPDGRIAAWDSAVTTNPHTHGGALPDPVVAMTSGRNAVPCYRLPAARVALHVVPAQVRTGALRSLAGAPNVFAIESAMDELAALAGADPLEFRLRHTDDPRLVAVLRRVAEQSRWATGRGLGLACAVYHGTYVAQVAEVAVAPGGTVRLVRAYCAIDCGALVNPDGARSQVEGGIVQAASWALFEELRHRDGHVVPAGWDGYPILGFRDAPDAIDISFIDDGAAEPTGLGEPGVVPVAAALANAVAASAGARVRELPLSPARVRAARTVGR